MAPAIGRSIQDGFRVANKSWAGMGVFALGWVAVGLLVTGLMAALGAVAPIPEELAREMARSEQVAVEPAADDEDAPATTAPAPAAPSTEATAPAMTQEQILSLALGWLGRAWPLLLLIVAVLMAAGGFLYGGQLGYVTKRMREGTAPALEVWHAGTRAIGPLMASSLLSLLATVGAALVIGLVVWVASLLPQVLGVVLGLLVVLALTVAVVWALVAITFWFIAIVADRQGVVAGIRASVHLVRGRWWKTFGLLVCLMLIAIGLALPLGLLEGVGQAVGGVGGGMLVFLSSVLQILVVNLYFGFVFSAAAIRYYDDAKTV
jgi:hypothetical protein